MSKSNCPSDRLSAKARFLNAQSDMFRTDLIKADLKRLSQLSQAQRRRLVVGAPAFLAGEGAK